MPSLVNWIIYGWINSKFLLYNTGKYIQYIHYTEINHDGKSVQLLSRVWLFATPWTAARQASLSITNSWSLPKLTSIESVMPSSYFILCCPLLLLPSIFPIFRVFSNESALQIRWPKYWSFCFNISPSNEHSGLTFRMDWLDLLAVQGTPKSLLQHHSSKASIFRRSAFFIVQLSHPYTTTGKAIALTRQTFVGKVMSLLFNIKENTHTHHIYIHTHNTHTHTHTHTHTQGLPWWLIWERIHLHCRRPGFNQWVGKIHWRRERLPTPVFWPGEFHGLSMGSQRVQPNWAAFTSLQNCIKCGKISDA